MAAVDYFIKFDGIKGESADVKHKDEIDVESWTWGETNTGGTAPGCSRRSTPSTTSARAAASATRAHKTTEWSHEQKSHPDESAVPRQTDGTT